MKPFKPILVALLALSLFAVIEVNAAPNMPGQPNDPCAPCQGPQPMHPCFGPHHQMITPEQRQKYYDIQKEFAPKMQGIKDKLFIQKNILQALKNSAQPDLAKIEATATTILKLHAEKRDLQKAIDEKVAKECGIQKPARPIPGVDVPPRHFRGHFGPEHFHHGPMGPMPH